MLLTDDEILEQDINLKAGILAHRALDRKNGRDPILRTVGELYERRKVAKVQLKKILEWGDELCDKGGEKVDLEWFQHKRECLHCWKILRKEVE